MRLTCVRVRRSLTHDLYCRGADEDDGGGGGLSDSPFYNAVCPSGGPR